MKSYCVWVNGKFEYHLRSRRAVASIMEILEMVYLSRRIDLVEMNPN